MQKSFLKHLHSSLCFGKIPAGMGRTERKCDIRVLSVHFFIYRIESIFVSEEMQSCGIGKLLLDYIKDKKVRLQLNVYQKNARAISFYRREGFIIQCEGLDEATGEKEYTMLWKQK